ncbi:hypothetical protein [Thalassotalea piscium]|uniref:Uncharacterized protein n=1 Tax=Thalassotalea piscium TaxID=1230533 RepID=A0A7X0TTE4_9GAMM|nr:hypothetical protein [Thalassotalea piscium]MBB6543136.1 hypothetical protein [Thalassotalea piscium]
MKKLILFLVLNVTFSTYAFDKWEYIERVDPMTDKDTSIAFVGESNCITNCSSVVVREDGSIIFKFSQFMDNDPIKIEYRFDKTEMSHTTVSISTDGTAGFLSKYEVPEFIAKLMHYKELTIRGYNYRGTPITFGITLNNSTSAIKNLTRYSNSKSLIQLNKEKKELANKIGVDEMTSLEHALETVKLVAGEESEAYKQVKAQYESALNKVKKTSHQDK